MIRAAIRLPCLAAPGTSLKALAEKLPAEVKRNWVHFSPAGIVKRRLVFDVGGDALTLQFAGTTGSPDYVTARYDAGELEQPLLTATAHAGCIIDTARRLSYDDAGRPEWLQDLDGTLRPIGEPEPLNPPVPAGHDPSGVPVGLVDTGVNYLLPDIASRLARDPAGEILGYDYWDLDRRPFDVSSIPDPFFPTRHGTEIADLVLDRAPVAKLLPYRYPRPEMTRMPALIADAAARGVRLMNVSLDGLDREDWLPFLAAATAHREILFMVAAGNYDRNIDQQPVYPAAFDLENMIVVTSATREGLLTMGVNWGPASVDLMVPGENLLVLDFDGERRLVSGSSYAAARVTALAACLLAEHPEWPTAMLKAAILQQAKVGESGVVGSGFIPDGVLGSQGACHGHQQLGVLQGPALL
jgi:subtilisin family serine protease